MLESLAVARFFLQFVVKQVRWSVTPTDLISNFYFFGQRLKLDIRA